MAACDSEYVFTYVDCGTPGKWSDGGVFANSALCHSMSDGSLNTPTAEHGK